MAKVDGALNIMLKELLENRKNKDNHSYNQDVTNYVEEETFDYSEKEVTKEIYTKWFKHVKKLIVNIYYIKTDIEPKCSYCERFLQDKNQIEFLKNLHILLNKSPNDISVNLIPCDWNCLELPLYISDAHGNLIYSPQISKAGDNYLIAFGKGVENFPSLELILQTDKFEKGERPIHRIVPAIGTIIELTQTFHFLGMTKKVKRSVKVVEILKPILTFLRTLDLDLSAFARHNKFSHSMGQYHRFTDNY